MTWIYGYTTKLREYGVDSSSARSPPQLLMLNELAGLPLRVAVLQTDFWFEHMKLPCLDCLVPSFLRAGALPGLTTLSRRLSHNNRKKLIAANVHTTHATIFFVMLPTQRAAAAGCVFTVARVRGEAEAWLGARLLSPHPAAPFPLPCPHPAPSMSWGHAMARVGVLFCHPCQPMREGAEEGGSCKPCGAV